MRKIIPDLFIASNFLVIAFSMAPIASLAREADDKNVDNRLKLEEVIVTAQKREQNVRDVPMSISVMSAEDLKVAGIQNFNDMMRFIPAVSFYDTSSSVYFRGIGTPESNPISEQAIAYIMDGIYIPKYSYLKPSFLDIERIEVLKGPQGTLFGRNATAGVINIINAKPTEDWQVSFSASAGERDIENTEIAVSGPITEKLSFRVAGRKKTESGWTYSKTDDAMLDDRNQEQARVSLQYDFNDTATIQLAVTRFDYILNGGTEFHAYPNDLKPIFFQLDPNLETNLDGESSTPLHLDDPDQRSDGGDGYIVPLTISWDMWDHSFTSITGYAKLYEDLGIDLDKTAIDLLASSVIQDEHQFSQEFRVASPSFELSFLPGNLDYTIGLYYFKNQTDAEIIVPLYGDIFNIIDSALLGNPVLDSTLGPLLNPIIGTLNGTLGLPRIVDLLGGNFDMKTESTAIFGQLNWRIIEDLTLTIGMRNSKDTKDLVLDVYTTGPLPFFPLITGAPFNVDKTNVFRDFSPKISLTWDVIDEVTTYFTYAEGFRAGSFNASATEIDNVEFKPESSVTLEAGIKSELLDGRMRVNIGWFDTVYTDYQVATFAGLGVVIQNAPEARASGVEADFMGILLPGLIVNGSAAYLDATFVDHADSSCPTDPYSQEEPQRFVTLQFIQPKRGCDVSGRRLHRSPEWTGSLGFNYSIGSYQFGWPVDFLIGADATFKDLEYQDSDLDPLDIQEAHWLYNARVGIKSADDSWRFVIHGKNLTNERVKVFSQDVPVQAGAHDSATNAPRYYFATFNYYYE